MRIIRSVATAVALGLVTRLGGAQSLPSVPSIPSGASAAAPAAVAKHAPSIETMYKQIGLVTHAAKGRTLDQQKVDGKECYETAKSQTGFDPLSAKTLSPTSPAVAPFKKAAGSCFKSRGYTLK